MQSEKPPEAQYRRSVMTMQLAADIVGPTLLGLVLDWQFGWLPWGTVAGLTFGLFASMYHLALIAKRLGRSEPPDDRGQS